MTIRHKDKYGSWAGKPRGYAPDFARCAEEVCPADLWPMRQCSRKRGHGPDGAYCKQHAKQYKEAES